jgi:hypothetical protein
VKDKRTIIDINDFSGGLVTNIPVTSMDTKYTPDCINVFGEGSKLKRRGGFSKLNSSSVAAGSAGNGMFNWVKSATDQLLIAVFGGKLYKMDLGGSSWDGTFDAISADANSGTPWTESITHFANYSGTLLMTNENRTHPQRISTTESSHFDIEAGGSGTAPKGKYIQVWKEHVWILNISAGGDLSEDFDSIASWTSSGGGTLSQTTLGDYETAKFVGANAATQNDAILTRDIGNIKDDYIVETRLYFDQLETVSATSTSQGYVLAHWDNGVTRLSTRWSDDGLEIYDGAAWYEVGVDKVSEDTWNTWKFIVTGGTATAARVDVLKDDTYIGVGLDMTYASADTASDGEIQITATGSTGTGATLFCDYVYVNAGNAQVEYFTDSNFSAWDDASTPTSPNLVAEPVQPYCHYRCDDDAANTTVTDAGSGGDNGALAGGDNTDDVSTTGKVNKAFSMNGTDDCVEADTVAGNIASDTAGTIAFWAYLDTWASNNESFVMISDADAGSFFQLGTGNASGKLLCRFWNANSEQWSLNQNDTSMFPTGSWIHWAIVQDGTSPKLYKNGVDITSATASTDLTQWLGDVTTIDTLRLMCTNYAGNGNTNFIDGKIEDFRYYQSALTAKQIRAIYADGSGSVAKATTSREGTTIKLGTYSYEFQHDGAGDVVGINQTLASGTGIAGTASVVGAWVYGTNTKTYKLRVYDGTSNHDTVELTANGTWQYQTLKFTPTSGATSIDFSIISTASAATYYVDGVSVEAQMTTPISDNADRIQRSAVNTSDDWSGTDSGNNDITTPKDVGLTGSFIINDRMYVTKKHSIHRFTYTASTPLLDIKQIRTSVGTASPRSVRNVVIPGQGEVVIFLGTDRRLYMFDGFDSVSIGDNVQLNNAITSVYLNNINTQALDKVFAVVHDDNHWYEIFVPIGTATVPDYSIVYDYVAKSFWPMSNRNFRAGAECDDGSGQAVVYVQGNTSGHSYLTSSGDSDDGSAINGYWISPKIGDSTILSRIDEINLQTKSVNATPTLQWREDFNATYTSVTLSSGTNKHNYNPKLTDNYIQFKIDDNSTNNAYEVWNLRALTKGIGHGA